MHDCDEILELLSARLDGELTAEEESTLADHLSQCPECQALAQDLATIHSVLPEMNEEPPQAIINAVMERITAQTGEVVPFPQKKGLPQRWRAWGGAAAVFLLATAGALGLHQGTLRAGNDATMSSGMAQEPVASIAQSALPLPEPSAAPSMATEIAPSAKMENQLTGADQPQESDSMRYAGPEEGMAPSHTPEASPSSGFSMTMIAPQPPSPEEAAQRLFAEVLNQTAPDGIWTQEDGITGYLLPDGEWSLTYLGLSEDGSDYIFMVHVGDEGGQRYAVPLDGSEIGLLAKDEEQ